MDPHGRLGRGLTSKQHHHQAPLCFVVYDTRMCLRKGQLNHVLSCLQHYECKQAS